MNKKIFNEIEEVWDKFSRKCSLKTGAILTVAYFIRSSKLKRNGGKK